MHFDAYGLDDRGSVPAGTGAHLVSYPVFSESSLSGGGVKIPEREAS
jgi:hypothetical protein